MVHIDLISGLGSKEIAVDFIKKAYRGKWNYFYKAIVGKRAKEWGFIPYYAFYH